MLCLHMPEKKIIVKPVIVGPNIISLRTSLQVPGGEINILAFGAWYQKYGQVRSSTVKLTKLRVQTTDKSDSNIFSRTL